MRARFIIEATRSGTITDVRVKRVCGCRVCDRWLPLSFLPALVAAILLLAVTGCGDGSVSKGNRASVVSSSVGARAAAAIEERLANAGYSVSPPRAPRGPKPPGQIRTFDVHLDFTSPKSFYVFIAVFDDHAAAVKYLRSSAARQLYGVERVIGPTFYSASPDLQTGSVSFSRPDLNRFIAFASGTSGR
jgi:hypothetical protein